MSIVNAWITPVAAMLCTDTACAPFGAGNIMYRAKMLPLPLANAVLACRGHLMFLGTLYQHCFMTGGTFDELADAMPRTLRNATGDFQTTLRAIGVVDPSLFRGQEGVLIGWSPKLGQMAGYEFGQDDLAAGFTIKQIGTHSIAPWDPSIDRLSSPKSETQMVALARVQVHLIKSLGVPGDVAGGDCHMAIITRDGLQIKCVADLDLLAPDNDH